MSEQEYESDERAGDTEDLPDYDFADPLKRDEELPGLDPAITIPPED